MSISAPKPRGRPREFDLQHVVSAAQYIFHARGYDFVSIVDLIAAVGVKGPSLYNAFGSKAGLYKRVLERYETHGAVPLKQLLRTDRSVASGLARVLDDAARRYSADLQASGCLVLEGCRAGDLDARDASRIAQAANEEMIRKFIATRHPQHARRLTDFMSSVMTGLSSQARRGQSLRQLLSTARIASKVLESELSG